MKKIFFLFLISSIFCNGYAQFVHEKYKFEKYDKLTWIAKIYYVNKDFCNALYYYKEALKVIPNDSPDIYFRAAVAALHLKDNDEAKWLIIESIKQKNTAKKYFLEYYEFDVFRENTLFKEIERDYEIYEKYFFKNLKNPQIYHELDNMIKKDQSIRETGGIYSDVDTANINRLIEITRKYGWQEKGWLVLWHQRGTYGEENYIWNFFKPFINDQIKKGNVRKYFWAMFDEDASIMTNQHQIYGLYWSQLEEFPIKDIENVDKRLQNVGLPPLWYMGKTLGVTLPQEYKGTPETSSL